MRRIRTYDYKVYITGPFQAGKTTFIHTLDESAISIEREMKREFHGEKSTTTTAFDLGRVMWVRREPHHSGLIIPKNVYHKERSEYEGWIENEIELRGVPGQLHFKTVRDAMRANTDGVLVLVDSSDPSMIGEALAMLAETKSSFDAIPIHVVANKQDRSSAASPGDVATWLGVDRATGMTAKDFASAENALTHLLLAIEQRMQTHDSDTHISSAPRAMHVG
ncbi:MAG: ADP-ribosylation factor-like protein [Candidatus Thorarchaeota archaeon]